MAAGSPPAASPDAALALHDNPERVKAQGVSITPSCPKGYAAVPLADYEPGFWDGLLSAAGFPSPPSSLPPHRITGTIPKATASGASTSGAPCSLKRKEIPPAGCTTRPPRPAPGSTPSSNARAGPVADTATAAVLGALAAPEVAKRSQRQGVTVVNVGNSHVAAFLVFKGRILGVYEHHTGMLDTDALLFDLKEFGFGWLPDEQVRAKGGHRLRVPCASAS